MSDVDPVSSEPLRLQPGLYELTLCFSVATAMVLGSRFSFIQSAKAHLAVFAIVGEIVLSFQFLGMWSFSPHDRII